MVCYRLCCLLLCAFNSLTQVCSYTYYLMASVEYVTCLNVSL